MKAEILLATQRAMKEYYSDPQLMNDITVEQHITDCIGGLVEKLSYSEGAVQPGAVAEFDYEELLKHDHTYEHGLHLDIIDNNNIVVKCCARYHGGDDILLIKIKKQ